ncbi:Uncharacterized protein Zm00014a_001544 [Zea mays]|uniref:Uncharacterized protein n=1 Tax=Zea mays TaxID=4577 RepID=A0A3L6EWY2_MAIZE|nr:Uncharacterized protein Zm00014a_001544 [Zea mays]
MGLCFSKKKPPAKPGKVAAAVSDDKAKKSPAQQPKRAAAAAANKAAVSAKDAAVPGEEKRRRSGSQGPAAEKQLPVVLVPSAPVRTSSCTKEEVDAILIQCGRLSRSSSGAGRAAASASGDTAAGGGGHRRRRSGSKRSYDFDQDGGADEECDWERQGRAAPVSSSRPSPHRGSPQRKRSGSRERSGAGAGSRRASRSPGRRADGAATSAGSGGGDRARQQPGKMVSVPAREKGRAPSPVPASGKRCASPRSSSPARMAAGTGNENAGACGPAAGPAPVLSRSSSRKNEQSPYRRCPMAELDDNALRNSSNHGARPHKKSAETAVAATPRKATGRGKEPTAVKEKLEITEASETRAHSSKTSSKTTTTPTLSVVAESLTQMPGAAQPGCRSRRASRDFDQNPGSYATQLLEDIHNYHQQSTSATPATPSISLPACVAKACSIVEAVADLNSSSSENRAYEHEPGHSADDKGSVNAPVGSGSDGFVEPSAAARKHLLPARDAHAETEPQESAGSNSVSGHPWTPSWEPTSAESTDRTWSTGDEVVEQSGSHGGRCSPMNRHQLSKQRQCQPELSGRSRAGSGNANGQYRGRSSAHRASGSVASGRSGVRAVSANS